MKPTDGIHIKEKRPKGKGSFDYLLKRIDENIKTVRDMRDVWDVVEPDLLEAFNYTFSMRNPSGWQGLSAKYLDYKRRHGYPDTIGILTGALKEAMTESANIKKARKYLSWGMGSGVTGHKGRPVEDYAGYFNRKRPIFTYVRTFYHKITKKVLKAIRTKGWT